MIDPITLGIAFTAAQQSVGYIKKAIARVMTAINTKKT